MHLGFADEHNSAGWPPLHTQLDSPMYQESKCGEIICAQDHNFFIEIILIQTHRLLSEKQKLTLKALSSSYTNLEM